MSFTNTFAQQAELWASLGNLVTPSVMLNLIPSDVSGFGESTRVSTHRHLRKGTPRPSG